MKREWMTLLRRRQTELQPDLKRLYKRLWLDGSVGNKDVAVNRQHIYILEQFFIRIKM